MHDRSSMVEGLYLSDRSQCFEVLRGFGILEVSENVEESMFMGWEEFLLG